MVPVDSESGKGLKNLLVRAWHEVKGVGPAKPQPKAAPEKSHE